MAYRIPPTMSTLILRSVNGKNGTASTIFTPTGKFNVWAVNFEVTDVSGLVSASSVSVGTNSSSFNDLLPITALTTLTTLNSTITIPINNTVKSVPQGTPIKVNVTTIAVGTTYAFDATIVGWYS